MLKRNCKQGIKALLKVPRNEIVIEAHENLLGIYQVRVELIHQGSIKVNERLNMTLEQAMDTARGISKALELSHAIKIADRNIRVAPGSFETVNTRLNIKK